VGAMERIIIVSEGEIPPRNPDDYDSDEETIAEIVGHLVHSACKEFKDICEVKPSYKKAKILCLTHSGLSAKMVSKYRPDLPILAVTARKRTARELRLVYGVEPIHIPDIEDELNTFVKIKRSVKYALDHDYIEPDENIIIAGNFFYKPARTNMISILNVKDLLD
ncbi:MAG: pyruvate kinase alpha/beta domain-containing protein, partial [Promethearchaeota archaeon]